MKLPNALISAAVFAFCNLASSAEDSKDCRDWRSIFHDTKATGTIVVSDDRAGGAGMAIYDELRSSKRFSPASTFKIPHALFALDAGIVRDEFQVFRWDGKDRGSDSWNRDQNLRSSIRHSVVWVYEGFAKELGEEREREYLKRIDYGNADPSGTAPFWVEGNLGISAVEQIDFLRRLYRNELPFRVEHQRLVKDLMVVEAGNAWILRAKTGWSGTVGWWVGWVEWPEGPVFFALNIDTPNRLDDLPKRELVTRRILKSVGALPKE